MKIQVKRIIKINGDIFYRVFVDGVITDSFYSDPDNRMEALAKAREKVAQIKANRHEVEEVIHEEEIPE